MELALEEFKELLQIRENVRRNANALELCSSCQRISECDEAISDNGRRLWLCNHCWNEIVVSAPGPEVPDRI